MGRLPRATVSGHPPAPDGFHEFRRGKIPQRDLDARQQLLPLSEPYLLGQAASVSPSPGVIRRLLRHPLVELSPRDSLQRAAAESAWLFLSGTGLMHFHPELRVRPDGGSPHGLPMEPPREWGNSVLRPMLRVTFFPPVLLLLSAGIYTSS